MNITNQELMPSVSRLRIAAQTARMATAQIETVIMLTEYGEAYSAEGRTWIQSARIALSDAACFLNADDGQGPVDAATDQRTALPTADLGPHPIADHILGDRAMIGFAPPLKISDVISVGDSAPESPGQLLGQPPLMPEIDPDDAAILGELDLSELSDEADQEADVGESVPYPPIVPVDGTTVGETYQVEIDPFTGIVVLCPCPAFQARHHCRHERVATAVLVKQFGLIVEDFAVCEHCDCPRDYVASRCTCADCATRHGTFIQKDGKYGRFGAPKPVRRTPAKARP